jgi:hypothetical protein
MTDDDTRYRAICACGEMTAYLPSDVVAGDWRDDHADRCREAAAGRCSIVTT